MLRALTTLLDEALPVVPGCEIHDDPLAPLCAACRARVARGGRRPADRLARAATQRYVEKLATPDVTIADMIGDLDPIKAARASLELSDELTMHYGLLPRANRGIFAINELPDLAGKIQVGLFNILQEGDVQIKGYPVRLPLDLHGGLQREPGGLHGARQDHHAAEGPHRLGDPHPLPGDAASRRWQITQQEAWTDARAGADRAVDPRLRARGGRGDRVPGARRIRRSTSARASASGCRSRCSRTSSRTPSGARSRPARRSPCRASPTSTRRMPAITGKFELEYEGELKGADNVARELIRSGRRRSSSTAGSRTPTSRQVTEWFDLGGNLQVDDALSAASWSRAPRRCRGCTSWRARPARQAAPAEPRARLGDRLRARRAVRAAQDQPLGEERSFQAAEQAPRAAARATMESADRARACRMTGGKKKYYN